MLPSNCLSMFASDEYLYCESMWWMFLSYLKTLLLSVLIFYSEHLNKFHTHSASMSWTSTREKKKYLLFSVISLQMTICDRSFIWNFSLASNNNDSMIWVRWSLRQVSLTVLDMISRYLHPTTRWLQGHCTNNTDELFVVIKQIKNEQKNVYAISNYYSCGRLLLSYSFGKL